MDWVGWVIGGVGVVLSVPILWLTIRASRRQAERHDVSWLPAYSDNGNFTLTNDGLDTAYEVRVVVRTREDGAVVDQEDRVDPNVGVLVYLDKHAQARREEEDRYERQKARSGAMSFIAVQPIHMRDVHWRVTWRSKLGRWDHAEGSTS